MRRYLTGPILVIALLLGAVMIAPDQGIAQSTPEVIRTDNPVIAPVIWELLALGLAGQPRQTPPESSRGLYTLQLLPDGTLLVQSDCNTGSGTYELAGYGITISPLTTTLALCAEGSLDAAFTSALNDVATFAYARDTLVLSQRAGAGSLVFVPALSGVVWNWQERQGTTPAVPSDPSAYTLIFDGEGSVLIQADCNQGSASYEVDGDGIALSPATMTRVACPPESLSDLYIQSLESVISFTFADGNLVLGLSDGSSLIFFATISVVESDATPVAG